MSFVHKPINPKKQQSQQNRGTICPVDKGEHYIGKCPKFLQMSPSEFNAEVKKNSFCYNCLSSTHNAKTCPSKVSCRHCSRNTTQCYMTKILSHSKKQRLLNTNFHYASPLMRSATKQNHQSTRLFSLEKLEISFLWFPLNFTVPTKPANVTHYLIAAALYLMFSIPW